MNTMEKKRREISVRFLRAFESYTDNLNGRQKACLFGLFKSIMDCEEGIVDPSYWCTDCSRKVKRFRELRNRFREMNVKALI